MIELLLITLFQAASGDPAVAETAAPPVAEAPVSTEQPSAVPVAEAPAATEPAPAAPQVAEAPAQPAAPAEVRHCRSEQVTGSRTMRRTICTTAAEDEAIHRQAREAQDRALLRGSINRPN